MSTRDALHELLDSLPDDMLPEAQQRLVALRDEALLRFFLTAPEEDDEELSPEELALFDDSEADDPAIEPLPLGGVQTELFSAD